MARHRASRAASPSLDRPAASLWSLLTVEITIGVLVAGMIVTAVLELGHGWPARHTSRPGALAIDSPTVLSTGQYAPIVSPSPRTATPATPASLRPTPSPPRPAPPDAAADPARPCLRATYSLSTRWPGGLQAQVVVTNCGTATVTGWRVTIGFSGSVTIEAWNADAPTHGQTATFTPKDYDRSIAAGGSATFGFNATWPRSDGTRKIKNCTLAQGTCSG